MSARHAYPTDEHARAAEIVTGFFASKQETSAVLLTCSCARGRGSRDSCLDMAVLVRPELLATERTRLEREWEELYGTESGFRDLLAVGRYSHVDLELFDGIFIPGYHGFTSGPDEFELEIGNYLAYSVPLHQRDGYLDELRARWLPFYDDGLRARRLAMVLGYCHNNLDHIDLFVRRHLHFQAFRRLYNAFGEFLQALFISRRTYPIAYDKWIREQVVDILGLPELYERLPGLFEIGRFESDELTRKAAVLEQLVETYVEEAR